MVLLLNNCRYLSVQEAFNGVIQHLTHELPMIASDKMQIQQVTKKSKKKFSKSELRELTKSRFDTLTLEKKLFYVK